jgi:alkanesulfonate monooxygenase SsuD/methylene tetrahydromethanopterin reductase-like flavin-dependent oxidoreductase (luciferase family)
MTAVGVPMSQRGARTDEYLDAMHALWTQPAPSYRGRYVAFDGIDAHPRAVQPDGPRIVIGGHSPAALRRAVARGHGWFGNGDSPHDLARHLAGLEKAATEVTRPARLGPLEITFMQLSPVDADTARRYADLGVDRLVVYPLPLENPADVSTFLERHADLPR